MQRKQNSDGGSTCTASSASSFPQVDVIGSDLEGIVKTIPYEHESVEMASLPKVLHTH
jgi:hypothetical protein